MLTSNANSLIKKTVINSNLIDNFRSITSKAAAVRNNQIKHNEQQIEQTEWNAAKSFKTIPGPSTLQLLTRNLPGGKYYKLTTDQVNTKLRDEYGSLVKLPGILGRSDLVMTYEPSDYETVFRNEGQWPIRKHIETLIHYRHKVRPEIFNNMGGLLTETGEPWSKMRKLVNPVMLPPKKVKIYIPAVDDVAKDFLKHILSKRDVNSEVPDNFIHELNLWALESIGVVALDQRLGVLSNTIKNEETNRLIQGLKDFLVLTFELEVLPSIWKYYKTPKFNKLMKAFDNMTFPVKRMIDEALRNIERKSPTTEDDDQHTSVLEKLVKIDRHIAIVMCIDMLLAGVDTTSTATIAIMYQLAKNSDKQDLLREEIMKILPNIDSPITPDTLNNIPYLRACFKEAMRMLPVTPGNARGATKNLILQGYKIPKGTEIAMSSILLMDPKYYPEPEKFMPERWLKEPSIESGKTCPLTKNVNPFIYLPFGFGARACIGRRFAEMEVEVIISRILRQYKLEYNYGAIKYVTGLINTPTGKVKFKFTEI